jgi:hypothetical protein
VTGGILLMGEGYYSTTSNSIAIPNINNVTVQGNCTVAKKEAAFVVDARKFHTPNLRDPRYTRVFQIVLKTLSIHIIGSHKQ